MEFNASPLSGNSQALEERVRTLEQGVSNHINDMTIHTTAAANADYTYDLGGREVRKVVYTNTSKNVVLYDEVSSWTPVGSLPQQLLSISRRYFIQGRVKTLVTTYAYDLSGALIGTNTREV